VCTLWVDLDASLLRLRDYCQPTRSCAYCGSFLEASIDLALETFTIIGIHQVAALEHSVRQLLYCMQQLCLAKR
jgi:hypothetical protein